MNRHTPLSATEMAELLTLARVCKVTEFARLLDALGASLRTPTADFETTIKRLRGIKKQSAQRGYREKYERKKHIT